MTATTATISQLLKTHFGYDSFKPNQEAIINDVLSGKDTLAIMPTGGGKSLCYQLPALAKNGTALVISPLIALMKDQVDALRANGIAAAYYNSSQPEEEQQQVLQQLTKGDLSLFYVAPESLPNLRHTISTITLNLIAIDEAHCISAWGHDFRPAYTKLGSLKQEFPHIPIIALTATADKATQDDISKQLNIPHAKKHLASFDRQNLFLDVRPGQSRIMQILKFLSPRGSQSGIIYCLSRKSTEKLAQKLKQSGYKAKAYHAGLSPEDRASIQEDFVNDTKPIIVATIAFGMGIDKSNVRWVIHYNMPKNIEGYYQEIGRAGRDGLKAHTLLFYSYADVIQLRRFAEGAATEEFQLAKLERMQHYAEALSCRRKALLNYFGEHLTKDCGYCDVCQNPPKYVDGTVIAQKVCSAVARVKEQEGVTMIVDVLRGAKNAQVFDKGYQHIKTYGAITNVSWNDLQQYIIQLINLGALEVYFHENGRLVLTPLAKAILFEGQKIQLAHTEDVKALKDVKTTKVTKNDSLFEQLRSKRSTIAAEKNVPAYIIFSDASLKDMIKKQPTTIKEFATISGVGKAKLEAYAEEFIAVITSYKAQQKPKVDTYQQTLELYTQGNTVEAISKERDLSENTIYSHLLKLHLEGALSLDLNEFVSQEELSKVKKATETLNNPEGLKPYYLHFEEKIPYWKLKFALTLLDT
jgi:ATP-dependent DNA helicase RecQ